MKRIGLLILCGLVMGVFSPSASATQYDLKQMTPEVEQAIANRQARYDQLEGFKTQRIVGENNKGYVQLLGENALAERLVNGENQDRKVIYHTIAQQNGLGPESYQVIETVFAEVRREKASPGQSIQLPSGQWIQRS